MHLALEHHTWSDDGLVLGGRLATRLVQEAGGTPLFVYDRGLIARRVSDLRSMLPRGLGVTYAVKANPMPALVGYMATLADGFDVASAGEMRIALDAGMDRGSVSFAGPGKTDQELRQAIAAGIVIEIESPAEMRRACQLSEVIGETPALAVRINPDFAVRASGMQMGGGPQQFGVDAEDVPQLLKEMTTTAAEFHGFHVFPGSQNLNADILAEAYARIGELVLRLADAAPTPPVRINLGGGFGIPYFPKDQPLDTGIVADALQQVCDRLWAAFRGVDLRIELGRYLVGEAGVYLTTIVDRKVSRGEVYLVTDGGLHHQLAASGNFGQRIRRNFPVAVASPAATLTETVNVVGCLCTPLDVLGDSVTLPKADVGDLIAVFQAGAYGATASPIQFLGHPRPVEMIV